mgnify:CR=1 FL=1
MTTWRLISTHSEAAEIRVGDTVTDFRGNECVVTYLFPPYRPGSSGRVGLLYLSGKTGDYYPSVVYAKFEQL